MKLRRKGSNQEWGKENYEIRKKKGGGGGGVGVI